MPENVTDSIVEEIVEEPTKIRLVAATYSPTPMAQNDIWSLSQGGYDIDKMIVSGDYHDQVDMSRFFYAHDGLAYTTINKQVEIGINGYGVNPSPESSEQETVVYEYLNELIRNYLVRAALEFMISGLVVPEITWGKVKSSEISGNLKRGYNRIYELPVDLWHRDPKSIILKKTPLPNKVTTFVKISDNDISFITNKGKFSDGTEDKDAYITLVKEYPEFVKAVKRGEKAFKLDDPILIRRYVQSGVVWPTPYLLPALELLIHKRNLRKMDYSIASRVISAIQLFRLGSDEFPLTEDDDDVVESLKAQMRWRGMTGNVERVFQLFSNHTLDISWITPDVAALLSETKYSSINDDILVALGLPRVIVSGEALRSGASNSSIALLPPASTIDSMRKTLLEFPRKIYKEVQTRNKFKGCPEPYYPPLRLQSMRELVEIGRSLYESAVISRTGWAELADFDFETEMYRMVNEKATMEDLGLPEFAPVPFSQKPDQMNQKQNDDKDDSVSEERDEKETNS